MKLSLASIVAFSLTAASHAALPPGYEDDQWCAKGDCSIFINPYGDAGAQVGAGVDFELLSNSLTFECRNPQLPQSSFSKCYNHKSYKVYEAVWTGSKSNQAPPKGWSKNPKQCPSKGGPQLSHPRPVPQVVGQNVGYHLVSQGKHTQCNTGASQGPFEDISDAATCANVCAAQGNMSSTLLFMGLNYFEDTQTCECLYGTQWETMDSYVGYVNGFVTCYAQDPFPCKYNASSNRCVGYTPGQTKYLRSD